MARTKTLKAGATERQVAEQVLQAAAMLGIELKRRNVGGFTNARGQYVACAESGDADFYVVLPDGRHLDLDGPTMIDHFGHTFAQHDIS